MWYDKKGAVKELLYPKTSTGGFYMDTNEMICKCKQVSYHDVADALHRMDKFEDVLKAFDEVQKMTNCSTGCGGCHDKILDAISEILMA